MAVTAAKACSSCGETKPLVEFHRNSQSADGHHAWCRRCKNGRASGYYKRWTPEQRELHRGRVLRSRYGIDLDLLRAMYERQEGCCAICAEPGSCPAPTDKSVTHSKTLCVDHNHKTGVVRGLLCRNCNSALGKFGDSKERLVKAAAYLVDTEGSDDLSQ